MKDPRQATFVYVDSRGRARVPNIFRPGETATVRVRHKAQGWYLWVLTARPEDEYACLYFKREYGIPEDRMLVVRDRDVEWGA